jgi:hypothetical protein
VIRAGAVLVASLGLILLVGCAAPVQDPEPSSSASGTSHVPTAIPDGVVATGELLLPDGSSFGTITIEKSAAGYLLSAPDIATLGNPHQLVTALADGDVTIDQCGEPNVWADSFAVFPDSSPTAYAPFEATYYSDDPSFFRHLLIVEPGRMGEACTQPILALATLEWEVPVTRPWIEVDDSGPVSGAQGGVLVDGGRPLVYRTAAGDMWDAIAARFGLTSDDLTYLNPIRLGNSEPGVAYADQLLNLDPTNRGDSETRRPGSELSQSDAF